MPKLKKIRKRLKRKVYHFRDRLAAVYYGRTRQHIFRDVTKYCTFIGYPRSGHTLIGALLDAHPGIIIAQEQNTLKYIKNGFSKYQIFYLLLQNSRRFTAAGRKWTGYSYQVPNQWNGRYRRLDVIGDKKAHYTTKLIESKKYLFDRLFEVIDTEHYFIHAIRNPFDNISTMSKRDKKPLANKIERYFRSCRTVQETRAKVDRGHWIDIRHEWLIQDPEHWIRQLCRFLDQPAPPDYLKSCASIVYKKPHQSRYDSPWNRELIEQVHTQIEQYEYLAGYSFDSL